MARKRKPAEEPLPLLAAAFFCEKILVEQDNNTPSIIRIVDIVNLPPAPTPPQPGTVLEVLLNFFVMFRAGDARGERELWIRQVNPSGQAIETGTWKFGLQDSPEGGSIIHTNHIPIRWDTDGTYWFELLLGDRLLTRVPLIVRANQLDSTTQTPAP